MDRQREFKLGEWQVTPLRGVIHGPQGSRRITPKAMDVLVCLAQHRGEVVKRETFLKDVWDGRVFSGEPLNKCIAELRRKLGDSDGSRDYIETIPKRGYRLVANVTQGRLPDGSSLEEAIRGVDEATAAAPAYYMINCAHLSHFIHLFDGDTNWSDRIYGVRANASCKSHAELDEAVELDDGDPEEFGQLYVELKKKLKNLVIVGGCCGTDDRHIGEVCRSFLYAE